MMLNQAPYRLVTILLLVGLLFVAGCNASGSQEPAAEETQSEEGVHEEDADHDHEDGEHEEEAHDETEPHGRIPNENGAAIHIITPTDGGTFQHGEQILVEVETENFDLSQEGYHWHVYVDGKSWGMVMGGNSDFPLSGVEPGEHEISAFLSIPSHEEYEDGDSITVTVEE